MSEFNKDLPTTWLKTTLDEVAHIEMGQSPESRFYNDNGQGLPFFQGKAEFEERYPRVRKWCSVPNKIAETGDILVSIRAPVGPTNIAQSRSCIGRGLAAICANPPINQLFLFYFFRHIESWLSDQGTGSTFAAISGQFLRKIEFVLAPAAEQTRIVEKLEELLSDLDAGVAELKAAQKKLVQYRQSLLKAAVEGALTAEWRTANQPKETGTQLLERILIERRARWEVKQLAKFKEQGKAPPKDWQAKYPEPVKPDTNDLPELPEGWVWASIDQVAEVFLGKMLDKTKHTSGAKMPYLRNVNVRWGNIQTHDISEMFFENDELDRYGLLAGDVLVCEGGEPGRAAICNKKHEILKYQKALHRVRLFDLYEPELLVAFLEFSAKTGRLEKNFTGSTINHFTKESFLALQIPIAPLNEQREIVETLLSATNTIDEQKSALEVAFKQSAAQRKNILKTAFSGQLVPQDPNDEPASVLLERIRNERQNNKIPIKRHRR